MENNIRIWADNTSESHKLIEFLNDVYSVDHILTASPQPVVRWNGDLIVGLGSIYSFFRSTSNKHYFHPEYE